MPTALITGISGQDGRYLAELMQAKGYRVFGLLHAEASSREPLLRRMLPFVELVRGDLADRPSLAAALEEVRPDEVYNLGAVSSVSRSWADPERTAEVTGLGTLRLLEAIRLCGLIDRVRFYQASSCEMYGRTASPQDETTVFSPVHPYGVAKVFAHQATVMFRQAYGLFAVAGILFNHESPRRGHEFVTRKITRGVARIALGLEDQLVLGDLDVRRDWGYAPEYVEAMWSMMQQPVPGDFIIATGVTRSLHDFLRLSFLEVGIEDYSPHVRHDRRLLRPADIAELRGNPAKARRLLDWEPRTGLEELVRIMVAADLRRERGALRAEPVGGRA